MLNATQTLLPVKWQFSNYATVMRKEPFLRYMLTTTWSASGSCSRISRPMVPWPAMT